MSCIKKCLWCCFPDPPEEHREPTVVEIKQKKQDMYLDAEDPISAIMESPQIQGLTVASIELFLDEGKDLSKQYSTVSQEEAKKYKQAVEEAKKQNPEVCTTLFKSLLKLLPSKKKMMRKKEKDRERERERRRSNRIAQTDDSKDMQPNQGSGFGRTSITADRTPSLIVPGETKSKGIQADSSINQIKPEVSSEFQSFDFKPRMVFVNGSLQPAPKNSYSKLENTKAVETLSVLKKNQPSNNENAKKGDRKYSMDQQLTLTAEEKRNLQEQKAFKSGLSKLVEEEDDQHLKVVKAFLYLYTSPYIYKTLNKKLSKGRYENYTKIVAFVTQSLKRLPSDKIQDFKLNFTTGFSMYRGLRGTKANFPERGFWKAFTSCTLNLAIAREFAGEDGVIVEIRFQPPVQHMYIKVPNNKQFSFFDQSQVILFPFFNYLVLQKKGENWVKVREVKRAEMLESEMDD